MNSSPRPKTIVMFQGTKYSHNAELSRGPSVTLCFEFTGACELSQNNDGLPDCASDEDFMEWFAEEVASCVPYNTGKSTPEEKVFT